MHPDAKITLYGGTAIGAAVLVAALYCDCTVLTATGTGLIGAALAVALGFDAVLGEDEPDAE